MEITNERNNNIACTVNFAVVSVSCTITCYMLGQPAWHHRFGDANAHNGKLDKILRYYIKNMGTWRR